MRKIIIKLSVCMLICCSMLYAKKQVRISQELLLSNVEALASGEGGGSYCYGYGSLDCNGYKVDRIIRS